MRLQQLIADDETDRSILERQAARIQGKNEPDNQQSEATQQGKEDQDGVPPRDTPAMPCPGTPSPGTPSPGTPTVAMPSSPSSPVRPSSPAREDEPLRRLATIPEDMPEEQIDDQPNDDQASIPELCEESDEDMPQYERESDDEPDDVKVMPGDHESDDEIEDVQPPAKRSRLALFREWKNKQEKHVDEKQEDIGEQIASCIRILSVLKEGGDVQAIIKSLEEQNGFSAPKNRRQRRSMNRQGQEEVFDISRPIQRLLNVQQKLEDLIVPPEESEMYRDATFFDDVTGSELNKKEAIKARRKEIQFFRDRRVYTKVSREAHMKIIATKWLDINKGDTTNPNLRARLVGCEFATDKREICLLPIHFLMVSE